MSEQGKQWCILRTSGRSTIGLSETLAKDGYDVWTPVETRRITVPRANVKRDVRLPMMPTYVFAASHHLGELLQLAAMPVRPRRGAGLLDAAHAAFHVLHCFGGIPIVGDRHLANLRRLEAKRTPVRRAAYVFPQNSKARVDDGPYGGMTGIVIRSTLTATTLDFGNGWSTQIPTSILLPADVEQHANAALMAA